MTICVVAAVFSVIAVVATDVIIVDVVQIVVGAAVRVLKSFTFGQNV